MILHQGPVTQVTLGHTDITLWSHWGTAMILHQGPVTQVMPGHTGITLWSHWGAAMIAMTLVMTLQWPWGVAMTKNSGLVAQVTLGSHVVPGGCFLRNQQLG